MKIIKLENLPNITIDSTFITVDSTITIDKTDLDYFAISIIPRFYGTDLLVNIREAIKNETYSFSTVGKEENGILKVFLNSFFPVNEVRYEIDIHSNDELIFSGLMMYSEQDIQNYSLNDSPIKKITF